MFKASFTYKQIVSMTTAFVVGFSALTPAYAQTRPADGEKAARENIKAKLTVSEQDRAATDVGILQGVGYNVKVDLNAKMTIAYSKQTGQAVMEIPFTDEKELRQYDPKNLERRLFNDLKVLWAAKKIDEAAEDVLTGRTALAAGQAIGKGAKFIMQPDAFIHSIQKLAPESLAFFIATGAVVASQLIFDYSQNPVSMEQHITHSLSPMGIISFQIFMYAQHGASNIFAMMIKDARFRVFLPYLGMTVGAIVSGYFGEVAADPNVKVCIKTWMGKKPSQEDLQMSDSNPCSKAYEYLVIHRKIWQMAPGIVSMLASTAVAGALEHGVKMEATKKAIRWTGANIKIGLRKTLGEGAALSARLAARSLSGLMYIEGVDMYLTKVLKLGLFVQLDHMFARSTNYTWKNIFDGRDLKYSVEFLEKSINEMKQAQWQGDDASVQKHFKTLKEQLAAWRQMNLQGPLEAHQMWQAALFQLTQGYQASESFYADVVEQIREQRSGQPADLARTAPLFGVRPDGMGMGPDDEAFIPSISDAAVAASMLLNSPEFNQLNPQEQSNFSSIVNDLGTRDPQRIQKSIDSLKSELKKSDTYRTRYYYSLLKQVSVMVEGTNQYKETRPRGGISADDLNILHTDPAFAEARQAYTVMDAAVAATQLFSSPEFKQLSASEKATFQSIVNGLGNKDLKKVGLTLMNLNNEMTKSARNITASRTYYSLLNQVRAMLGNPDPMMQSGRPWMETYISSPKQYAKVKDTNYYRRVGIYATPKITDYMLMQMICGPDIENGGSVVRNSAGFPSVFLPPAIGNSNDEFYECEGINDSANASRIYDWQVKSVGGSYNGWVQYLLAQGRPSAVGTTDGETFKKWWSNNTYPQMKKAFEQYSEDYDKIVVDLLKGIYSPGRSVLNNGPAYNGAMNSIFQEERAYLSILNDMMKPAATYSMNFANIMSQAPTHPALKAVETEFAKMNGLMKQIQVVKVGGRDRILSSLQNEQFEAQMTNIQSALSKVAEVLGTSTNSSQANPMQGRENPQAADAATLDKLLNSIEEENAAPAPVKPKPVAQFKLTKAQNNLAVGILEALQGLAMEMKNYASITNAMSWDKINNLDQVNKSQKKMKDAVDNQANSILRR